MSNETRRAAAVTLADVAREVGVHPATVSRVLSRSEMVNPQTRQRIEEVVARMGYVPNRAARQLVSGRTATVGMLVPDITNPFFASIVSEAQRRALATGLQLLLADTSHVVGQELALVAALAPNIDGLIVCSPVAPAARIVASLGRPLVFVNRAAREIPAVLVDQQQVVEMAVGHLRCLGHRRIGVMTGPSSYWSSGQRTRAARHLGEDVVVLPPAPPTFEGGRNSIVTVIDSGVTGVVAFNDVAAMGLIAGARDHGLDVPRDLSIVGSDDVSLASMSNPALTTIAAPLARMGSESVDLLVAAIEGKPPAVVTLDVALVERESTAAPRAVALRSQVGEDGGEPFDGLDGDGVDDQLQM